MSGQKNAFVATGAGILTGVFSIPILKNVFDHLQFFELFAVPIIFGVVTLAIYGLFYKLRRVWTFGPRIGKFIIVGGLNTVIDLLVLNLLISTFGIAVGALYGIFKGISFIVASTNSYVWNKWWTFEYTEPPSAREYARFFIFTAIGAIVNISVALLFVRLFTSSYSNSVLLANIGALIATLASLVWNFISYYLVVFRTREKSHVQS